MLMLNILDIIFIFPFGMYDIDKITFHIYSGVDYLPD